jgi:general secretion pathway protein D
MGTLPQKISNMGGIELPGSLSGFLPVFGVMLVSWLPLTSVAGHANSPAGNLVAIDFENVDLRIFIKFVSEATGRIFLVDDRVRGQVSVRFTNEIPIDRLYEVLESVLEVKGYAAVPAGYITKIVPLNTTKQRGIEVTGRDAVKSADRR